MKIDVQADHRGDGQRLCHGLDLLDQACVVFEEPLRAGVGRRLQGVQHRAQVLLRAVQLGNDPGGVRRCVFFRRRAQRESGVVRGLRQGVVQLEFFRTGLLAAAGYIQHQAK
ncbi:hypothetical protein G6F59_017388 [Rhizopus arrhizus]|nr:hypothetical protein G6F59_017388 [Rhizopus arrhizus]